MRAAATISSRSDLLDRATGRARRRLLPILLLMYVLSYLDRANIGYAKQAYQAATGLSDAAFAFGAGVFFLTYALFEIPSNLMLHRVGARIWLGRIMMTWGLISAATIFATSRGAFNLVRLLLGAAEAGFFPGAILFLTYWFPARRRGEVMAFFYSGAPLALMLGGPFSGLLLHLDGLFGLAGWKLLFLVEGLAASAVGLAAFFFLPEHPGKARWMPAPEREALAQAIALEEEGKKREGVVGLAEVFKNLRLMRFTAIYTLIQISGYGVAFYLPTQISALLGVRIGPLVGLVSGIPWACAIIAGAWWPAFAIRTGRRRMGAAISLLAIAVGLCLSAWLPPVAAIAGLCLATSGIITPQPIFWTYPTAYFGGVGAAAGIATINALGNLGGFVAPTLKTWLEHGFGPASGLYFLAGSALLAALLVAGLQEVSERSQS
jgi:sugar phosphate permease